MARSRSRSRRRDRSRSRRPKPRSRSRRPRSSSRRRPRVSRSKSRRNRKRDITPERVPPTNFADYEPIDGTGWYTYKKMGKWKFHAETGLYQHVKSDVYYIQKDGDPKAFRKIDDMSDHVIKKMKQSEEMREAIQATQFVQFGTKNAEAPPPFDPDEVDAPPPAEPAPAHVPGPVAEAAKASAQPSPGAAGQKFAGTVREWSTEKGFGFITPDGTDDEKAKSVFVHLWNVVGSSQKNPINLKEGARVQYSVEEQDGRLRAMNVVMLEKDGTPKSVHAGAQRLEEKRKSYYITASVLGVRAHCESWPGRQEDLNDRFICDMPMEELGVYFGIFGGTNGSQVSDYASKLLHKHILGQFRQKQVQPASRDEKLKSAVKEAFLQTDKDILGASERKKFEHSGTSALVAMLHGNPKLGSALRLVLAHVGDTRAILCRGGDVVALSEDHRPERIEEKKRVEAAGGLVLNVRGQWRIAAPTGNKSAGKQSRKEYKGVTVTRSLGDSSFKTPPLLIPDPEVKVVSLTDRDLFLITASSGVLSVLSNREVIDLALDHWEDPEAASKNIVRKAFQLGADGNLTAMVIQFGWNDKGAPAFVSRRKTMAAQGLDGGSPKIKAKPGTQVAALSLKAVEDDGFSMFG